jgi:hypothetical protein
VESLYTLRISETRAMSLSFIASLGNPKCLVIAEPCYAEASIYYLFGKPMFVFQVDGSGHTVLGWVWFVVVVCSLLSLVVFLLCTRTRLRKPVV